MNDSTRRNFLRQSALGLAGRFASPQALCCRPLPRAVLGVHRRQPSRRHNSTLVKAHPARLHDGMQKALPRGRASAHCTLLTIRLRLVWMMLPNLFHVTTFSLLQPVILHRPKRIRWGITILAPAPFVSLVYPAPSHSAPLTVARRESL